MEETNQACLLPRVDLSVSKLWILSEGSAKLVAN
jgi:hypothetical protein